MYNNKFYGYLINSAVKTDKPEKEEPDYQKTGLLGIYNYLNSTNPKKKYYGAN